MINIGATVRRRDSSHEMRDDKLSDGFGGNCSGDVHENGMNDRKLGNSFEDGMRFNCWRIANIRKCRVT